MPDRYETITSPQTHPSHPFLSISTAKTLMQTTIPSLLKPYKCTLTGLPAMTFHEAIRALPFPEGWFPPLFFSVQERQSFSRQRLKDYPPRQTKTFQPSCLPLTCSSLREGPELAALRGSCYSITCSGCCVGYFLLTSLCGQHPRMGSVFQ